MITRDAMFEVLGSLGCGVGRWTVAGSGPLLALHIVDAIADLDVVADPTAFECLGATAVDPIRTGANGDRIARLAIDSFAVEVFDGWYGQPAAEIIERSEVVEGHRFMNLATVEDYKRRLDRPKDRAHLRAIATHRSGGDPSGR